MTGKFTHAWQSSDDFIFYPVCHTTDVLLKLTFFIFLYYFFFFLAKARFSHMGRITDDRRFHCFTAIADNWLCRLVKTHKHEHHRSPGVVRNKILECFCFPDHDVPDIYNVGWWEIISVFIFMSAKSMLDGQEKAKFRTFWISVSDIWKQSNLTPVFTQINLAWVLQYFTIKRCDKMDI